MDRSAYPRGVKRNWEAKTGCSANMRQLGWVPKRWSEVTGEPLEFHKVAAGETFVASRDRSYQWYLRVRAMVPGHTPNGGIFWPAREVSSARFPSALALAHWAAILDAAEPVVRVWMQVEKSNGSFSTNTG